VELLQLSDHQLVSGDGVASWNVLEMHIHAWMHYADALTYPSKQDASLLKQFLSVALVLPAAVAVHDRAVLTEVYRFIYQSDQVRLMALQEVSEGLFSQLQQSETHSVIHGGRHSAPDKCHALCCLILPREAANNCRVLAPLLLTENKKTRGYPIIQVSCTELPLLWSSDFAFKPLCCWLCPCIRTCFFF